MKRLPPWLTYTLLRVLAIVVPLVLLVLLFGYRNWLYATIAAVLIGWAISIIFLRRQRDAMSGEVWEIRSRGRQPAKGDEAAEDDAVDAASTDPLD